MSHAEATVSLSMKLTRSLQQGTWSQPRHRRCIHRPRGRRPPRCAGRGWGPGLQPAQTARSCPPQGWGPWVGEPSAAAGAADPAGSRLQETAADLSRPCAGLAQSRSVCCKCSAVSEILHSPCHLTPLVKTCHLETRATLSGWDAHEQWRCYAAAKSSAKCRQCRRVGKATRSAALDAGQPVQQGAGRHAGGIMRPLFAHCNKQPRLPVFTGSLTGGHHWLAPQDAKPLFVTLRMLNGPRRERM